MRIPSCASAQLCLLGGSQVNTGCSEELPVSQLAWGGLSKPKGPLEVLLEQNLSASTKLPLGITVTAESMTQDGFVPKN